MPDPLNDDPSLGELLERERQEIRRQEVAAEESKLDEKVEELEKKRQERPDWWTTTDLLMDNSTLRPEGFLANDEMLQRGTVNLVFGPGGSFKTFLMMHLMECIVIGVPFAGLPTRKGRCLFFSEEMPRPQITKRVENLYGNPQAHGDAIAWRFHDPDAPFDFFSEPELSKKRLIRAILSSNSPDVVILDALVDLMTADEVNNTQVGIVLRAIRDVAIKTNCCIIIIDHSGKPNEFRKRSDRARGASVKRDICADMLLVDGIGTSERPKSSGEWTKHRDLTHQISPFNFTLDVDSSDPDKTVITFDYRVAVEMTNDANKLVEVIEELSTVLKIPVSRTDLKTKITDVEKWHRRRFDEALSFCYRNERIIRTKEGNEAFFSLSTRCT